MGVATLEILVKGNTSTCIERQESLAEASSVEAGASVWGFTRDATSEDLGQRLADH